VANLAAVRSLVGAGVPVHPVVKANAYGHGAIEVAAALEAAGADGLCVATADEALALRESGVGIPILVLFPVPPAMAAELARRRVAVAAGDLELLRATADAMALAAAGAGRRSPRPAPLGVHLEIETGLGRGGFDEGDLGRAAALIATSPALRIAGLWTHLQAPEDAIRTARQLERFEAGTARLRDAGYSIPPRHVAASGGLLVGDVASLEGIRPGLAIYGLIPDELLETEAARRIDLHPVMSLHARPVRVAELPAGWGIGYGPTFVTSRASRIATLPLGYGDGWARALSNRAVALVRGQPVPLVGNVAMDAVMADVTDLPGEPVAIADEFVLLGRQEGHSITAAEVAAARSTNAWEVVTAMAARLPRVYHAPSGTLGLATLTTSRRSPRQRSPRP
jgi:alanine racemase